MSGHITPTTTNHVKQNVPAKYLDYSNAFVQGEKIEFYYPCIKVKLSHLLPDDK